MPLPKPPQRARPARRSPEDQVKPAAVPIDAVDLLPLVRWVGATRIMINKGKELGWFRSNEIVMLAVDG